MSFHSYTASGGTNNTFFDSNECNDLTIRLLNSGTEELTGLSASLNSNTSGVLISQANSAYPNIAVGATGTNTVAFRVSTTNQFYPGKPINFVLTVSTGQGVFPISFSTTVPSSTATRFNHSTATPIPDAPRPGQTGVLGSSLSVSGLSGTLAEVQVYLHITHPRLRELVVTLIAPDGSTVLLVNKRGGNGSNFGSGCADSLRTRFVDSGTTAISAGTAPFVGVFRPEQPLTQHRNKVASSMNGTWTLRVADTKRNNVGTLQCWSLLVATIPVVPSSGVCAGTPTADMSLFKTVSPSVIPNGGSLTYSLSVHNSGPNAATNVVVSDPLPPSLTFASASSTQGSFTASNGLITFNLGSLAVNASVICTITAVANTPGTITNKASVSANENDTNASNNTSSAVSYIQTIADVAVTLTDLPDPVVTGKNVVYTMNVTNPSGPDAATSVTLKLSWSSGGAYVSSSSTVGTVVQSGSNSTTCFIGPLDVGASVQVTVTLTPPGCGTFFTTASLETIDHDGNTANNTASQKTTVNDPPPTISISPPTHSITATGPVYYTVTYAGATSVTLATPNITLNKTGSANGTIGVSGTGADSRIVTISNIVGNGTLGISISAATAVSCGAFAPAAGPSQTFVVDSTQPSVVSIDRADPSPTSTTLVNFTVIFNQSVTGLSSNNFTFVGAGVNGTIGTVTGSGTTYNVAVSVSGNGTAKINLDRNISSIRNATNQPLQYSFTGGQHYIIDQTGPTLVAIQRVGSTPTNSNSLNFSVIFDEPVRGVSAGNFATTGTLSGTINMPTTTDNKSWLVVVSGVTGSGTLGLTKTSNENVSDATGNPLTGGNVPGEVYAVDQIAPTSTASVTDSTRAGGGILHINFTASDVDSEISEVRLYVRGPGDAALVDSSLEFEGAEGTFEYSVTTGNGIYQFATQAVDAAGNVEVIPSGPDAFVIFNSVVNGNFVHTVEAPNAELIFPMTDDLDIKITVNSATVGTTVAVNRITPITDPPGYFRRASQLVNESLSISTGSDLGGSGHSLEWQFDPANAAELDDTQINSVFVFKGGEDPVATYSATTVDNVISVSGIDEFSEWYAGNAAAVPVQFSAFTVD